MEINLNKIGGIERILKYTIKIIFSPLNFHKAIILKKKKNNNFKTTEETRYQSKSAATWSSSGGTGKGRENKRQFRVVP